MKALPFISLITGLCLCLSCRESAQVVRIGTYNLRMAPLDRGTENAWEVREPRLVESFLNEDMDICGVQEVDASEQESIPRLLAQKGLEYDSFFFCPYAQDGVGGRAHGVLWKKDRFSAGEPHFFWTSDPPELMQENDHCGRINYIRGGFCITLTDHNNRDARYFVMVTHAPLNKEDHAAYAYVFVEMEKKYNPEGLPSFFLGDLNAHEKDACMETYRAYWTDTYLFFDRQPQLRQGPEGTYNGWDPESTVRSDRRIDFIYFRGDGVEPLNYRCEDRLYQGLCASDHFPVVADFRISAQLSPRGRKERE